MANADPARSPANPATLYLESLSAGSRRTMQQSLRQVIALAGQTERYTPETMPWADLDYATLVQVRAALARRYRPATANKTLAALRGLLLACKHLRLLSAEAFDQRLEWLPSVKGSSLPKGRALSPAQLSRLLQCCAAAPDGAQDAAILALLYGAGLRRSELCALDLRDYDAAAEMVNVRVAKGNQQRRVRLLAGTAAWLNAWLSTRGDSPGPLFSPQRRGNFVRAMAETLRQSGVPLRYIVGCRADGVWITSDAPPPHPRLTGDQIFALLQRRAQQAGLGHLTPHDLRRTFVTHLLDAKNDLATVQRMAGHARPETTIRYDRRPEDAERAAAQSVRVPPPVG